MNKYYMLVSTLLLVAAFIPFIYSYEKRKLRAREIVLLAVMCAITAVSNIVCAYTIPFHAGTAMVIVAGISLGTQSGFFVGAMSRFVCNIFMGQGVWTPWEMFAWGLLGALAGIMFNKIEFIGYLDDKKYVYRKQLKSGAAVLIVPFVCIASAEIIGYITFLFTAAENESFLGWRLYAFGFLGIVLAAVFQKKKLPANFITMSVFTFVSVFIIYGGIMNVAAFFMTESVYEGGLDSLLLLYITGAPYDALHAFGASVCVFLFGDTVVRKLERVKIKYGI